MLETLKNKNDFDQVYSKGKVFGNHYFTVRYYKNGLNYNRYGIVISKRTAKRAVVRNRLRRQIKAYLQRNEKNIKTGYDLIISVKARCVNQEYKTLVKALDHLFYKTKLKK